MFDKKIVILMEDKNIEWEELLNINDDKSDNQDIRIIDLEMINN